MVYKETDTQNNFGNLKETQKMHGRQNESESKSKGGDAKLNLTETQKMIQIQIRKHSS